MSSSQAAPGELLTDPLLGKTIAGRFTIKAFLGRGASGVVYLADQEATHREIALKILSLEKNLEPKAQERFAREAKMAAQLSHPNTITVYDYGQDGEHRFIAMEYLSGRSLAERIHEGPLSPAEACLIGQQILSSLEDAHQHGIVHRDLKPENVFLVRRVGQDLVKVLDFGIAKARRESGLTTEGTTHGTPHYMSPEQVRGDELDGRTDLYSVGVILYEMLCGARPFQGNSSMEIASKQLKDTPPSLLSRQPALRDAKPLVQVVERAMSKSRDKRYSDATEMRQALSAAQSQPAAAPRATLAWLSLSASLVLLLSALAYRLLSAAPASLLVTAKAGAQLQLNQQAAEPAPLRRLGLSAGDEVTLTTTSQKVSLTLKPGTNLVSLSPSEVQ